MDWVVVRGDARELATVLGTYDTYIWSAVACAARLGWTEQRVEATLAFLVEQGVALPIEDGYIAAPWSERGVFGTAIYNPRVDAVTILWPEESHSGDEPLVLDGDLSTTSRLVWRRGESGAPSMVELLEVSVAMTSEPGRQDDRALLYSLGIRPDNSQDQRGAVVRVDARIDPFDLGFAPRFEFREPSAST